jgi:CMP-N-acetylneuraminic acid synthetase
VQNCVVDVIRTDIILYSQSMTGKRVRPYVMDARFSVDIDTETDLLLAEALLAMEDKKQ